MQTIKVTDTFTTYTYEIVESIPAGFKIWNIPLDGLEGYVPLCELLYPFDETCHKINPDTLKVIKCDNAKILIEAANYGAGTLKKCQQMIGRLERKQERGKGTPFDKVRLQCFYAALPVFESLPWEEN